MEFLLLFLLNLLEGFINERRGTITDFLDGLDDGIVINLTLVKIDDHVVGKQRDVYVSNSIDFAHCSVDISLAGSTHHSGYVVLLLHRYPQGVL